MPLLLTGKLRLRFQELSTVSKVTEIVRQNRDLLPGLVASNFFPDFGPTLTARETNSPPFLSTGGNWPPPSVTGVSANFYPAFAPDLF